MIVDKMNVGEVNSLMERKKKGRNQESGDEGGDQEYFSFFASPVLSLVRRQGKRETGVCSPLDWWTWPLAPRMDTPNQPPDP